MKTGIFTMKRVLAFTIAVVASMTMLAGGTQPVMTAQNASAESQAIKNNKKKISSAKDKISELEQKQAESAFPQCRPPPFSPLPSDASRAASARLPAPFHALPPAFPGRESP